MRIGFIKSDFIKNVSVLASGTAIAQLIPFLTLPFLQKYFYTPEQFGLLTVYNYLSVVIAGLSTLSYEFSIVTQSRYKNSINIMFLALYIVLFFFIASLMAVMFGAKKIAVMMGSEAIEPFLWLVPVTVLAMGMGNILIYWNNRNKSFKLMSMVKITQSSSAEATKIICGWAGFSAGGLIIGRVLGQISGMLVSLINFLKRDIKKIKLHSFNKIKLLAVEHKDYPMYNAPGVFIGMLINLSYIQLLLKFYGEGMVGIIGVSLSYISGGLGMISSSFSQVFYREIADIEDKNRLLKIYKKLAVRLFALSALIVLIVYLLPENIIISFLGDKWDNLLKYLRVIILWSSVSFVTSSLSFIYMKVKKQKEMMLLNLFQLLLIITTIIIVHKTYNNEYYTLWGLCISQIICYIFAFILAILFIKRYNSTK